MQKKNHKWKKQERKSRTPRREPSLDKKKETTSLPKTNLNYLKKFKQIIIDRNGSFISGVDIEQEFLKSGWKIDGPNDIWRIWREVELERPRLIEFTPQSSVYWTKKPSGWRFIGGNLSEEDN